MADRLKTVHQARLARLQKLIRQPVIITEQPNLFWLTGFTGSSGAACVVRDRAWFVTDPRYDEQAREELADGFEILIDTQAPEVVIAKKNLLTEFSSYTLEEEVVTHARSKAWAKALDPLKPDLEPSPITPLRRIKEKVEVQAVRRALALTEEAMAWIAHWVKPGVRESELAARLEFYCRMKGASGPAFDLIVASGPNSARPHGVAGSRKIMNNEVVLFDIGFVVAGYSSDFTRVVFCGKRPPVGLVNMHQRVLEAQNRAKAAIAPGLDLAYPDQVVREWFKSQGVLKLYGHSLGHGLGLEVHEAPRLSYRSQGKLEAGMLVTVEPGLYRAGRYGVRLEDVVLVTKSGVQVLTDFPLDLARIHPV